MTENTICVADACALCLQVHAEKLIAGLGGERTRWEAGAAEFEAALAAVPGDAALASAFLTYAGPFPADFRTALADGAWKSQACTMPTSLLPDTTLLSCAVKVSNGKESSMPEIC